MSKKTNWAEVDKRIRARRAVWTQHERAELEDSLKKLPDVASEGHVLDVLQPALIGSKVEAERSN
jgi:hypothetical protein